ncbi:MAG TPA: DUF892 family protein [Candidatus Binatia bacterium]|nr:DUF892 family protein [Candidatus Binatia bacterium]
MDKARMTELLLQSLEHEKGGVKIYEIALRCAQNEDLKKEWQKYLEQTRRHVEVLEQVCGTLDIGIDGDKPMGVKIVAMLGESLVRAMEAGLKAGDLVAAQVLAAECVTLAETKDHMDWELIGECAKKLTGEQKKILQAAYDEVEDQEDEHLYHTKGWCRELWLESLGLKAMLPPPEERKHVKTAIGAARAEQSLKH